MGIAMIKRALISVSDKTGLLPFAAALVAQKIEILSTGGTAQLLRTHQIPVIDIADYTAFPEMMAGRLKTLHPKIFGGILGRRTVDDAIMAAHQIPPIDLLVVNLYPFVQVTQQADCDFSKAIEHIDIGGPSLLRAAAKNHQDVLVVVDQKDYQKVTHALQTDTITLNLRQYLAQKVFAHTSIYDQAIAQYLITATESVEQKAEWSPQCEFHYTQPDALRYGENPHQKAALYHSQNPLAGTVAQAQLLQGKALSYNNLVDADTAWECVKGLTEPACVIVKHANPCGVAQAHDLLQAYQYAYRGDPTSSFGGIVAFNRELDAMTARTLLAQQFVEVVIAPAVTDEACSVFTTKPNVRLLACGEFDLSVVDALDYKRIAGGLLVQQCDDMQAPKQQTVVTKVRPTALQHSDLLFAWHVVSWVKSNAIVFAKDKATLGIGAGQMSRIDSTRIAGFKAADVNLDLTHAVMASDAFFPFKDAIDKAVELGIKAIIQPGGSKRDQEVIQAADEAGIAMIFTGQRHFRH